MAAPVAVKPTLSSLTPNRGRRGVTATVTVKGANFTTPATVNVQGSGIIVSNVLVVDPDTVTANFRVSGTAARGSRNITVTTAAGTSNALPFSVQ